MNSGTCLEAIRALWAGILELPLARVTADSHFLQLGGDSLHWTRMATQLEQLSGIRVPPMLQVQWATPQRCVEQWQSAGQAPGPGPFSAESSDPYCFPATPMQRGIWFAQQLAGDEALYAGAVLLHFSGVLDPARLQQALQCLYAELPLLRARFRLDVATRRLMVDCPENRAGVPVMAVHRLPLHEQPAFLEDWLKIREGHGSPAPFRATLLQSGDQRFQLAVQLHHLICDGWSGNLLLARLARIYNGAAAPGLELAFAHHAWRLAEARDVEEQALAHWRGRLAGFADAQRSLFACDAEAPWPYRVQTCTVKLPGELRSACEQAARARGVTPFILCQLACKLALARLQGEPRQVLALPRSLRRAGEESAIGCFVSLQLTASCMPELTDPGPILRNEAQRFAEDCSINVPLDTLSARLAPARLPDGNPWSTVLLAFQNFPQRVPCWKGLECQLERLPAKRSQFALCLEFMPVGDGWHLRIDYAPALFDSLWLERLRSGLAAALEELTH